MSSIQNKKVDELKALSMLLDSQFSGPFGLKFGLDGILGLIPGIGDLITTSMSVYIIFQAATLGCTPSTLARMGLNIVIENVVDIIPVFGHVFDFLWKANNKNIELLDQHILNPRAVTLKSRFILGGIIVILLSLLTISAVMSYYVIQWFINLF
jgi:hypothetical protein